MTAMDDLLNSSSIELSTTTVQVDWAELEPGYASVSGTSPSGAESIRQMGQQIGPNGFTVTQSFDDGLPDPVTSTGNNDASGTFQMDLVGRPTATAGLSSLHWNALSTNGVGTGTTITTTMPTDPAFWDYVLVAITVNSDTLVTETSVPADSLFAWKLLADVSDVVGGSTYHTWVFGRKHYTSGSVAPAFKLDASASYGWVIGSIDVGRTPSWQVMVPITPGDIETSGETATVTTHNQTPVTIGGRGWNVGIFGGRNDAAPWSSAGNTVVGQTTGGNVSTAIITSPLRQTDGLYSISGTSSIATSGVAMIHIAMEVRDRPALDGVGYFSTMNPLSPIYGFERDTATVLAATNHIARDGSGLQTNIVYTGQMAGISITDRTATMNGVSRTRLLLDDSHQLPTVYGWREGCTTDWLTGWLLAQGGQYLGVAPSVYTRWWVPCYGSLHAYMDGSAGYASCDEVNPSRTKFRQSPTSIDGPFATAMWGQQTDTKQITNYWSADRNWATDVPGIPNPSIKDFMSQQNGIGRLSFWIRGDVASQAPSYITSGNPDDLMLFDFILWYHYLGHDLPYTIRVSVNPNRNFTVQLAGTSTVLTGGDLPSDGLWHFCCFDWDFPNGVGRFVRDNVLWTPTGFASATSALPPTEAAVITTGGYIAQSGAARLPVSDIQLESGQPYGDISRLYPTPTAPSKNVTYRPTRQPLSVIATQTPVQGWSTLQSLAQSTLSHLRVNESDNVEFLPLDYFGEAAQMTVSTANVLNTDFNAGDLNLVDDPSQTRNVVTVEYTDTMVGSARSTILEMNTSLAVPVGVSYMTFPLDTPTAETHGAAQWWNSTPEFQKLTAAQVAGSTAIQNENVMSVNTLSDGSGTVFTSTAFTARIYDWDAYNIVVQFTNTYSSTLYLANNGTQIPFLRALGYAISTNDSYATLRDYGSIGSRRERALTTQLDWVTDRATAYGVGNSLVTQLARPRPGITVTVQGDPRRKPGDLCSLVDSTGMQASGTWRVMKVVHNGNGPMYTQDLDLIRVGTIAVWDQGTWDETVWGE